MTLSRRNDVLRPAMMPVVEAVEARRLLSAVLEDGILRVEGTDLGESIVIKAGNRLISVKVGDDASQLFNVRRVQQVEVRAGAGDDTIRITSKPQLIAEVDGEAGNDSIFSGAGNDSLDGGDGNDYIRGGGGHDLIKGGTGDDSLIGDQGNDTLGGDAGDDDLVGANGADELNGGDGNDDLYGGLGLDSVRGGRGRDVFHQKDDKAETKDRNKRIDGREETISITQVPAAVLDAFRATYPDALIKKVQLDGESDQYEIEFFDNGVKKEVKYSASGTFVEGNIALEAVPEVVRNAFLAFLATDPGATLQTVESEIEDGDTQYKFDFTSSAGVEQEARYNSLGVLVRLETRKSG